MNESEQSEKVIIADKQFLIIESLRLLLERDKRFVVAGIAGSMEELIKILKQEKATILLIDCSLAELTSFSELKKILSGYPDMKVLVITNSVTKSELHELNNIGIKNILLKTAEEEEIFAAINSLLKGKKYYSTDLLDLLFEENERKKAEEVTCQLTGSEIEIVRLITEGLTTKEIAARKNISFHTVITHRKNIFRKLDVSSVSELIIHAIKAGWINNIEYYI